MGANKEDIETKEKESNIQSSEINSSRKDIKTIHDVMDLKKVTQEEIDSKIYEEISKTQEDQESNDDIILRYHATSFKKDQFDKTAKENEINTKNMKSDMCTESSDVKGQDKKYFKAHDSENVCAVSDQGDSSVAIDVKEEEMESKVDVKMSLVQEDQGSNDKSS